MKKLIKKAFTLVELLVVIAILAALATVGIISFSAYTKKANTTKDETIIGQMNHYVEAYKALDNKVNVPSDVQQELSTHGLRIEDLDCANKDSYYAFNLTNKNFEYISDLNSVINKSYLMLFVDSSSKMTSNEFSYYLQSGFDATTLNTKTSIDTGVNTNIKTITYTTIDQAGTSSVIYTNSFNTEININAPYDNVTHYGKANKVNIVAVASSSYHEEGIILGNITLNNGRVVMENESSANAIYINASASDINSGSVKVSAENTKTPEVPVIVRDYVKVASDTKGGDNNIPNPLTNNVIVLSDKVLDENQVVLGDAVAYVKSTNKNYLTVQEALDALNGNDTLLLLKDITNCEPLTSYKTIDATYKIDLNNHSITFKTTGVDNNAMGLSLDNKGTYIISNGTLNCDSYLYGDVLDVLCDATLNNLTINYNDPIHDGSARWGAIYNGANTTINSCTINAISGPGIQNGEENLKLVINDSKIVSNDHSALYCGGGSITEVNNCIVEGVRAIHACTSGCLFYINSGSFNGSSNVIQLDNTKNSRDYLGVENYVGGSFAFIYNGSFNGNVSMNAYNNGVAALYVYGGTFTADVSQYRR